MGSWSGTAMSEYKRADWHAHEEDGTWWAWSDDAPGATAAAGTWDELLRLIREAMWDMFGPSVWVVLKEPLP